MEDGPCREERERLRKAANALVAADTRFPLATVVTPLSKTEYALPSNVAVAVVQMAPNKEGKNVPQKVLRFRDREGHDLLPITVSSNPAPEDIPF